MPRYVRRSQVEQIADLETELLQVRNDYRKLRVWLLRHYPAVYHQYNDEILVRIMGLRSKED